MYEVVIEENYTTIKKAGVLALPEFSLKLEIRSWMLEARFAE